MGGRLEGSSGSREQWGQESRVQTVPDGFLPKVTLFELKHLTPIN